MNGYIDFECLKEMNLRLKLRSGLKKLISVDNFHSNNSQIKKTISVKLFRFHLVELNKHKMNESHQHYKPSSQYKTASKS
jgi:hypothetical protein